MYRYASAVSFAGIVPCGQGSDKANACTFASLLILARNVEVFLLNNVLIPVSVLSIGIAGAMYIGAGVGWFGSIAKAKDVLQNVVIGILLAWGGWAIIYAFVSVFAAPGFSPLQTS